MIFFLRLMKRKKPRKLKRLKMELLILMIMERVLRKLLQLVVELVVLVLVELEVLEATVEPEVLEVTVVPEVLQIFGDQVHITQITHIKPRLLLSKQLMKSLPNKEQPKLCQTKTSHQPKPSTPNKLNNKRTVSEVQEEK